MAWSSVSASTVGTTGGWYARPDTLPIAPAVPQVPSIEARAPAIDTTRPLDDSLRTLRPDVRELVRAIIQQGAAAGAYPGAAVVIRQSGTDVVHAGFGRQDWSAESRPVDPARTWYDLASLTKVLGTTTALLVLVDQGRVDLDAPAGHWLPGWSEGAKAHVTVRDLLLHRSGLPAGRELWRLSGGMEARRSAVLGTPLVYAPRTQMVYSDLGADLLGFIVEAASGERLDAAVQHLVLGPLRLGGLQYGVPAGWRSWTAPTEVHPPRGYPLVAEVHDENAYALGGVAGHAGLFGTADAVADLGQLWLNEGTLRGVRLVRAETVRHFVARQGGRRALGWEVCTPGEGTCGRLLSPQAFGHTGYTGTSLWVDPDAHLVVVVLTNRVHQPHAARSMTILRDVRADVADAAAASRLPIGQLAEGLRQSWGTLRSAVQEGWQPVVRQLAGRHQLARQGRHASGVRLASRRRSAAGKRTRLALGHSGARARRRSN